MNQGDVLRMTANRGGVSAEVAHKVILAFLDVLALSLSCDEPVMLRGFGKLTPAVRAPRTHRNPQNGEPVETGERRTITFTPSSTLRERLNGG